MRTSRWDRTAARSGGLGLVASVVMAVAVLASPGVALAALPPVAGLTSATHPSETNWYRSAAPAFTWGAPAGGTGAVAAYEYALDRDPVTSDPSANRVSATAFASSDLDVGIRPLSIVTADFNGDGKVDLAIAGQPTTASGDVAVLLGDGPAVSRLPRS